MSEKQSETPKKKNWSLSKIIVFDTETTGLPGVGEIIEIGAIKYNKAGQKYKIVDIFNERIKPLTDFWSEQAAQTHQIKKEQLKNCRTIHQVLPDFLKFLDPEYIVAGHRIGFDCTFVRDFCKVVNLPFPKNPVLDTYKIAVKILEIDKILAKRNFKKNFDLHLKDLIKYYNVTYTLGNHHRAYVDALTTAEVFFKMKNGLKFSQMLPEYFDTLQYTLLKKLVKENKINAN